MARKVVAPVPEDRSVNAPSFIASAPQVLGLYNQAHKDDKRERVNDTVKNWYREKMYSLGWDKVTFSGNQAILEANISLKKVSVK